MRCCFCKHDFQNIHEENECKTVRFQKTLYVTPSVCLLCYSVLCVDDDHKNYTICCLVVGSLGWGSFKLITFLISLSNDRKMILLSIIFPNIDLNFNRRFSTIYSNSCLMLWLLHATQIELSITLTAKYPNQDIHNSQNVHTEKKFLLCNLQWPYDMAAIYAYQYTAKCVIPKKPTFSAKLLCYGKKKYTAAINAEIWQRYSNVGNQQQKSTFF